MQQSWIILSEQKNLFKIKVSETPGKYNLNKSFQEFLALSDDEQREREHLEKCIDRAFYEAGRALKIIRDKRLYRNTHKTFEEYCLDRFGYNSRRQPYLLIQASHVIDNLSEQCDQFDHILPTNEYQIRSLASLEPDEQRSAWKQAVEKAGGKVPSAKVVKSIVDKIQERTKLPNPYRVGEICILLPKNNPELRGKNGCWGTITNVGEFSCTIQTWDGEYTVKIEHLLLVELSDDNCELMRQLLARMQNLYALPKRDFVIDNLLAFFGKQPTLLTPIQEEIFSTIEKANRSLLVLPSQSANSVMKS